MDSVFVMEMQNSPTEHSRLEGGSHKVDEQPASDDSKQSCTATADDNEEVAEPCIRENQSKTLSETDSVVWSARSSETHVEEGAGAENAEPSNHSSHSVADRASCSCLPRAKRASSGLPSSVNVQLERHLEAAIEDAVSACGVSGDLLRLHVQCLVAAGKAAETELDSLSKVQQWRRSRRRLAHLLTRLGTTEEGLERLMCIRPEAVRANDTEVRRYQGLYQSMARLRTSKQALKNGVSVEQKAIQNLEARTDPVAGTGTEMPRVRISHLYYLQRQLILEEARHRRCCGSPMSRGWRRLLRLCPGGQMADEEPLEFEVVVASPRNSETDQSQSLRDSFSVHPVGAPAERDPTPSVVGSSSPLSSGYRSTGHR